jgi:hypothetical protein
VRLFFLLTASERGTSCSLQTSGSGDVCDAREPGYVRKTPWAVDGPLLDGQMGTSVNEDRVSDFGGLEDCDDVDCDDVDCDDVDDAFSLLLSSIESPFRVPRLRRLTAQMASVVCLRTPLSFNKWKSRECP